MDKRVDLVAHEKAKADNYTARKKLEDERFVRSQQKTKIINDMQLKQKQLRQLTTSAYSDRLAGHASDSGT
ncbi:MAG: hypothetical protein IPP85_09815 [Propionivibrio sp.]|nr:hypothetical protein [Propionivibrio sp.]